MSDTTNASEQEVKKEVDETTTAASSEIKQDDLVAKLQAEAQNALAIAESEREARKKSEKKIVEMKRKAKEFGMEDDEQPEPLDPEVIAQKAAEIIATKQASEESELQKSKKTIEELATALKSRTNISNSSTGTNQDRYESEPDPLKQLSAADLRFIEARAAREGLSTREYLKKHPTS